MIRKIVFSLATLAALAGPRANAASPDVLEPVVRKLEALASRLPSATEPGERARILLLTGKPGEARDLLKAEGGTRDLYLAACFALGDFPAIRDVLGDPASLREPGEDSGSLRERSRHRELVYRWLRTADDLESLKARADAAFASRDVTPADRRARALLAALTFRYDEATKGFEEALAASESAADSALAFAGLGDVAYRQRDFDRSLERLEPALALSDPDPNLLLLLAGTLIRLGRTDDAIASCELAVRVGPFHERSHYYLGNGYARKNYTQLFAAYPDAFTSGAEEAAMDDADSLWTAGDLGAARAAYEAMLETRPAADVLTRLGSLDYMEGDYAAARVHFGRALDLCPEYGRAHNGMAKAVEAQRLAVEVHRSDYEAAFARAPMPEVPGIETFVVNWASLGERHRKRVALSMEPWKRYIPVLVASGSTYYIKPLYELLSQTPGQETLRDQRISYDSRLWDDVRGCGGYHTVTGIEDVERTVMNRYNTVLHELTHQVHAVLPAPRKRAIQALYKAAKERDEAGEDAFLSRYAGGSVWEYFAEGANALHSPRRDAFDDREIVLERLEAKDPDLLALVNTIADKGDVDSCYVVGYTNRGDDLLERGMADEAIAAYRHALSRDATEETALGSLVFSLEVSNHVLAAGLIAEIAGARDPESATLALRTADCLWLSGAGLEAAIKSLVEARPGVREDERYRVDQALGTLYWVAGKPAECLAAYAAVLEYQSDDPMGLWGTALALALAGNWNDAWEAYDRAVRLRTGVVDLRIDYARDLLRAGETERAREQIEEGLLLDAEDPNLLAMKAWALVAGGDADEGAAVADSALSANPWCDTARIVLAMARSRAGHADDAASVLAPLVERMEREAPPEYVYRAKWGRYDRVRTLPAVERTLVSELRGGRER